MVQDRYIQRRRVRLAALLLAALLLTTFGIGTVSALIWRTETVDAEGLAGAFNSLALDGAGNPGISYFDQSHGNLKYAAYNGSAWTRQTADSAVNVGWHTSLALDSAGNPRISYYDQARSNLKYAWRDGSGWHSETVDDVREVGWYTSLALDSAGNPRISYCEMTNGDLKYAAYNGSAWTIQAVDQAGTVGEYSSLALDSADNPSISYYDATNADLKYAAYNGSAWTNQTVDTAVNVGQYPSLALDGAGNPRISYYDVARSKLKYAAYDGSAWTNQTVDTAGDVGWYTSLALDSAGNPSISYFDMTNDDVKYAAYNGSAWTIQAVDQAGTVGEYTSLALDSAGNPRISYYDATNRDLKYARGDPPAAPAISIETLVSVDSGTSWYTANSPPGPSAAVGAAVQWRYTVTNTGNVPLTNVTVTDDRGVVVTAPKTALAPGESMNATASGVAVAGQYANNGTATGTYGTQHVSATDVSHYFGAAPGIRIRVLTNGVDANAPPGPSIPVGAPVIWTYVIRNTGNVDLTSVTVTDDRGVVVTAPKTSLAPGESMNATASGTAIEGQYSNVGTVNATYGTQPVSATDPSHYLGIALPIAAFTANTTSGVAPLTVGFTNSSTGAVDSRSWDFGDGTTSTEADPAHTFAAAGTYIVNLTVANIAGSNSTTRTVSVTAPAPSISIRKYVSVDECITWLDANTPPGPYLNRSGVDPWFRFNVTNTGNVPLTNVAISDSVLGPIGETIPSLAPGGWSQAVTNGTWAAGAQTNIGSVTGAYGTQTVSASDPCHYFGADPGISIKVYTNGRDADTPPGPSVGVGAPVAWTYVVRNTGNVDLTGIMVTDNRGVTVTAPKTALAPGESMNATASGTAIEGQYANVGTAGGTPPGGLSGVSATDPSHYLGITLPIAAFTADTTVGTAPLTVRFTDRSTGVIDSRSWSFGDGATSTEANPTHTFATGGSYAVTLRVTNIAGSNSTTRTVDMANHPWIAADFTANVTSGVLPLAVRFTDASTGPVKTWAWEFGDGATSTERNPVHTFTKTGTYSVRLLVGDYQSADNEIRTDYITVMSSPPVGGDHGYFLVSTNPANATIYLEEISGTRYVKGTTADGPLNVTICLTCTPVRQLVATKPGYRDAVFTITHYPPNGMTVPVELVLVPNGTPGSIAVPGGTGVPGDLDGDGFCEDVNGNGRVDFADVVLFFNQMSWIAANEPTGLFDYNGNGRIDFADVVWLFTHL